MADRDVELKQVMAADRSRGRGQPDTVLSLEEKRQIRRAMDMLANRRCDKRRYIQVIRDDFGLEEGSDRFQQYMNAWDEFRGR
jgi:hypothetical protein